MLHRAITTVLALVAVLGLLTTPFARQAMMMPAAMAQGAAAANMADMPCCPEETPVSDCAKSCPLMALCATQLFAESSVVAMTLAAPLARIASANDARLAGVPDHPPPKPPRHLT